MSRDNLISYYSIIPATIRYDKKLKAAEKLMYGEITALSNRLGYCFANNRYFAELYNVTIHTVSQWISNLEKQGYIKTELIKSKSKAIKERRIYIVDNPYVQKNTYYYRFKNTYPIDENVKDNNMKKNIDDLFNLIIDKSKKISDDFYEILEKLEFLYQREMLDMMKEEKIEMLKEIIYALYDLYNDKFVSVLSNIKREKLINLYILAKKNKPDNLLEYYKKSIINST